MSAVSDEKKAKLAPSPHSQVQRAASGASDREERALRATLQFVKRRRSSEEPEEPTYVSAGAPSFRVRTQRDVARAAEAVSVPSAAPAVPARRSSLARVVWPLAGGGLLVAAALLHGSLRELQHAVPVRVGAQSAAYAAQPAPRAVADAVRAPAGTAPPTAVVPSANPQPAPARTQLERLQSASAIRTPKRAVPQPAMSAVAAAVDPGPPSDDGNAEVAPSASPPKPRARLVEDPVRPKLLD